MSRRSTRAAVQLLAALVAALLLAALAVIPGASPADAQQELYDDRVDGAPQWVNYRMSTSGHQVFGPVSQSSGAIEVQATATVSFNPLGWAPEAIRDAIKANFEFSVTASGQYHPSQAGCLKHDQVMVVAIPWEEMVAQNWTRYEIVGWTIYGHAIKEFHGTHQTQYWQAADKVPATEEYCVPPEADKAMFLNELTRGNYDALAQYQPHNRSAGNGDSSNSGPGDSGKPGSGTGNSGGQSEPGDNTGCGDCGENIGDHGPPSGESGGQTSGNTGENGNGGAGDGMDDRHHDGQEEDCKESDYKANHSCKDGEWHPHM